MDKNIKTSSLTEAAFITGILVIFSLIGTFIFSVTDFIYPIPIIILAKRKGYRVSLLALIAAALIITMLLGIQVGIYYIVLFSPVAAVMAFLISKNKKPSIVLAAGTVSYIISFVLMIMISQVIVGVNFVDQIKEIFTQSLNIQESLFENFKSLQIDIEDFKESYNQLLEMTIIIIPAVIILMSAAMTAINYFIVYKLSKRLKINVIPINDFSKFKLPNNLYIGILIILIGMVILKQINYPNYQNLYTNIIFLIMMLMFVQGLALIRYLFIKYKLSKVIRIIIVVLIFLNPIIFNGVMIVGAAETLFDFRKLRRKRG